MKKILFISCFIFLLAHLVAQTGIENDSAFIRNNYIKKETYITMRDGIRLFTTIYSPKDQSKKYPILMKRTPYTVAPYGATEFITRFQNMTLARQGNIFVFQDVRGRWMSEGEFVDIRPVVANRKSNKDVDESTDTYDTVDWLVKNVENNNGRVGVYGISYPGFYATNALVEAHPSVKAVSPQAPVTDWFIGDDFHHGGTFMLMDGFSFYRNFGRPHPKPVLPKDFEERPLSYPDNYNFYLKMGALPNFTKKYMGDTIKFWTDLMSHPNYDAFWKARNIRPHLKNTKPAVLTVGGLFDAEDCYGAWRTYEALEKQNTPSVSNRIVMGPWFHGAWGGRSEGAFLGNVQFGSKTSDYYQTKIEAPFFNFYLKDEGQLDLPEATIFETGSNKWTNYTHWPPTNTKTRNIYMQPNGKLNFSTPSVPTGSTSWISDPSKPVPYTEDVHEDRTREYMTDDQRFAARRPDVLVFETDVLQEDLTVTGPIDATLFFSTTGTDADLVVKVIDVFPDDAPQWEGSKVPQGGYQMLVRGEILRGRFRNSWEKPEPFTPSLVTKVPVQLPDIAHTFKKGHRLMVQIQSSWFPIADRNPQKFVNIYQAKDSDFQKATHRIFHNAKNASHLTIRVLDK
ncbi:MAG: CocE/NonD family hydrolase [Saprospiraceae bacterium]|nr:CocE/NonD family hydrolase [Saprospiraceae bacterium]